MAAIAGKQDATDVIVRYDTSGGRTVRVGTRVPVWTVYGDGFVVWTDEDAEPTPGYASSVWTGWLDPEALQGLMTLAQETGFFELESGYQPIAETYLPLGAGQAEPIDPPPLPLDAKTETLGVSLGDYRHRVSVCPAGWPGAPTAFRNLRDAARSLVPRESRRLAPREHRDGGASYLRLLAVPPLPPREP